MTADTDLDLLGLIEKRCPRRDDTDTRVVFEEGWMKNLAIFAGKHYFAILGNQIYDIPPLEHEIRYKANLVKPAVLRAVAKILGLNPRMTCAPESGSSRHLELARLSDHVLQHIRTATGYDYERAMALLWSCVCGTSFMRNIWDPESGESDRFYWLDEKDKRVIPASLLGPDAVAQRDRDGWYDDEPSGEVSFECVPPFQAYPDPMSKGKIEHCRWFVQQQFIDRAWVAERFNVEEKDLELDNASTALLRWEEALSMMTAATTFRTLQGSTFDRQNMNHCRLVQMWERPSRAHKKGRYVVTVGARVLRNKPNPYAGDKRGWTHLPFTKVSWIPMPGRFWDLGLVEDLVSPQFRRNESRSRMFEFERVFGRPPTFVPQGSGIPTGLSIRPGAVYEYKQTTQGGKIEHGPPPQLPREVAENASVCTGEIDRIAAQSEIDSSKFPGQMRSGAALRQMTQERDVVLSITLMSVLKADRDCARAALTLAKLFYDTRRLASIRGPNGQWSVLAFLGAELSTDVRIISQPGELETTAQEDGRLLDFITSGALQPATNPQDKQIMLRALRYHSTEQFVTDNVQHEALQEEEIRRMIGNPLAYQDAPYPVMPWEDHVAHKRVLERLFNNLDEFEPLTKEQKAVLSTHWEAHQRALMQEQAQAAAMMEAARGAPGQKGVASQPAPA